MDERSRDERRRDESARRKRHFAVLEFPRFPGIRSLPVVLPPGRRSGPRATPA